MRARRVASWQRGSRMSLTRLQSCVIGVVLTAIYLLAYRHGQFGRHGSCQCGQSSPSLRGQEELLESMPHSERLMVDCMLEQPDTRTAVRQRLRACLADRGAHPPSDRLSFPPVDPLQQQPGQALEPQATALARAPSPPPSGAVAAADRPSVALASPVGPLQQQVAEAAENEAALPSAPLEVQLVERRARDATPPAVRDAAEAAAAAGTLVLITCVGNGKFLAMSEPPKTWLACAGRPGSTPVLDGLFVKEPLSGQRVAFRHLQSGHYMQLVPKGQEPAWVVRVERASAGDLETFEIRQAAGHTYVYSVAAGCHLNFRFGDILRGHNKAGQAAGAIPSARMQLTPFGQVAPLP